MEATILGTPRLDRHLATYRAQIADRLASGETTQEKLDQLHKDLDLDHMEHAKYQETKSLAFMEGKITQDEAQQIYIWLGGSPSVFNRRPLEVKSLVTKIVGELLSHQSRRG